jgi:general bacterial porin, GBP family
MLMAKGRRFVGAGIVGAALLAVCGGAAAQSSITLYGTVDTYAQYLSNGGVHSTSLLSGGSSASEFGLKGSEALGNGLNAIFNLENGFTVNNGAFFVDSSSMFYRQSWVGFSHESYGRLTMGRQYEPSFYAVYPAEPFHADEMLSPLAAFLLAAERNTLATQYDPGRASNSIMYQSSNLGGARLYAMYALAATQSAPVPARVGNTLDIAASYTNGTLYVGFGYHNQHGGTETIPLVPGTLTNLEQLPTEHFAGALAYRIGIVNLQAIYKYTRPKDPEPGSLIAIAGLAHSVSNIQIGATVQAGAQDAIAIAVNKRDVRGAHDNAVGIEVGVDHNLSKRTSVYARAGYIKNNGDSTVSWPGIPVEEGGTKQILAVVGMTHRF